MSRTRSQTPAMADRLYARRRLRNAVAIALGILTACFGLFFLGWILWTLASKAIGGIEAQQGEAGTPAE